MRFSVARAKNLILRNIKENNTIKNGFLRFFYKFATAETEASFNYIEKKKIKV